MSNVYLPWTLVLMQETVINQVQTEITRKEAILLIATNQRILAHRDPTENHWTGESSEHGFIFKSR